VQTASSLLSLSFASSNLIDNQQLQRVVKLSLLSNCKKKGIMSSTDIAAKLPKANKEKKKKGELAWSC